MSFMDFLAASPTSYHACAEATRLLAEAGFVPQRESDPWDASPGGHFVQRDGAIIAYRLPDEMGPDLRFHIVGAHTDSPGFKLKPYPFHRSAGWAQAGMEVYGGPLLNSWLDREFGLAGRVVLRSGEQRLIATDPWLRIPQLAPHLDRSVNQSLHLDQQQALMPLYALLERTGASGMTSNQRLSFDMRIDNPALTAQVLVSSARAATCLASGCYTLIDIPPVAFLPGERMGHIARLV